ncbi:MAG: hypothetical protein RLZ82_100 [Actinomycetota bacterium]|jgi:uncharacterized LabA/DUF88 family protein
MKRVLVLVDGFNLFHAISDLNPTMTDINIHALANRLIRRQHEQIVGIDYFSSLITHLNKQTISNQESYLENLRSTGVRVVLGRFRPRSQECPRCGLVKISHVEKETDVNLASTLVAKVFEEACDKVLLFSADSDMRGAISAVKAKYPKVPIWLVSTAKYLQPVHRSLGKIVDGQIRLNQQMINQHLF